MKRKYHILKKWILGNIEEKKIYPGDKLPSEHELCREFGLSRNSVRAALRELAEEGLLETRKGVGTFCIKPVARKKLETNIGFICFFTHSYIFPEIIRGCGQVLYRSGFHILLNQSEYDLAREQSILLGLRKKGVDGIILEPVFSGEGASNIALIRDLEERGIPVVLIDNHFPGEKVTSITMDDFMCGYRAASYLWNMGHTRIGVFYEHDYLPKVSRKDGVLAFLKEHHAVPEERWIAGFRGQGPDSEARSRAAEILSLPDLPTAFFCSSDYDALQFIQEAEKKGILIPGDLSIIGFDNSRIARLGKIPLTTMEHPSAYVGQSAARIILDRIYNPDVTAVSTTVIEPRLVERDSVQRLS